MQEDNCIIALKEEHIEANEKTLDELKRTKLLIIDRRRINLGGHKRKEDKIKNLLNVELDETLQELYFHYPPDRFYVETVSTYEDAIGAAKQILFDFFVFYKLEYENKKDASNLILSLSQINASSNRAPFYLVAYRSMNTFREDGFYAADTNFERYSSLKDEKDCKSSIEKVIFKCKECALAGRLKHIVFVGDLRSETMILLMSILSAERWKYNGIKCIAYENNEFLEFVSKDLKKGFFSFTKH